KFRLNPLRLEWTVSLQSAATPLDATLPCCGTSPIVADASGAYVAGFSAVFKVSPVDGSVLWSQSVAPDSVNALDADSANPADVLAVGPNIVTSLARSDGVTRWNHVPTGTISAYAGFDDSVAVIGNAAPGEPTANPGFLKRIRRDDGMVLWQQPITGSVGAESSIYGVGEDAGRISASGVQCETGQAPELCELVIWNTSVDGGALTMSKPMLRQSVKFSGSAGDATTSVAAAEVATPNGQRILVRRIRNSDGVVLWETSILASLPDAPGRAIQELNIVLTRSASSDVVVGFGRRPAGAVTPQPTGNAVLVKLNGSDGALQWRRSLLNSADGFTETASSPFSVETDTSGNVLASMHEVRPNVVSGLWGADRREVRTYSSATGQELLRVGFQPTHSPTGFFLPALPWFQVVGDVLITGEPPLPRTDFGVFGIDPTAGSVLWNYSGPSHLAQPFLADGLVAFSASVRSTPSQIRLSRFDANTGNVAWESTYGHPSDPVYTQPVMSRGSDNGVYLGTTSRMFPNASTSQFPSTPRILRADDASGTITWVNRFDNGPVPPQFLARPLFGNNGVLVTVQPAIRASASRGSFLTGLSEADGAFQGTSVLAFDNFGWPQLPTTTFGLRDLAADGAMIVRRSGDMPGQPTRFSLRKLPFPQTFSGGSLRVNLSQSVATNGTQKIASFRFDVVNDGSVSASAVEAIIGLPKLAIIDSAECTIAGSPCTVEATPALFRSVTDIAVGEHLVLTGKIRFQVSLAAGDSLEASAFSTGGLVEMDMKDNIASINLADVLFSAGFE
ncbi:MAG: PQQ-binding-like beta-propeller repeat protein, partial [Dokdonella sp.]